MQHTLHPSTNCSMTNGLREQDMNSVTQTKRSRRGSPSPGDPARLAAVCLSLMLGACDLAVELPGDITAEELEQPEDLPLLVTSAEGVFECAYQQYVLLSAQLVDEFMSGGSDGAYYIYDQREITPATGTYSSGGCPGGQLAGLYTPLSQARWFSDSNLQRAQEAGSQDMVARSAVLAGYAYTLFGEGFCSAAYDGGPEVLPPQSLELAEDRFSTAISSGSGDLQTLAYLGRARARLNQGDMAGAISDAQQVPDGFAYYATRSSADNSRQNHLYGSNWIDRNIEVDVPFWNLEWQGVPDPRVELIHTGNTGRNGLNPEVLQTKYPDYDADIPIGRYAEALLIIAEAAGGQTAVDNINELHTRAGLPPFVSDDPAEIMAQVHEERRRELFIEGHRMNDMLRLNIPFPSGADPFNDRRYGETTCFPLPDIERENNPNIP